MTCPLSRASHLLLAVVLLMAVLGAHSVSAAWPQKSGKKSPIQGRVPAGMAADPMVFLSSPLAVYDFGGIPGPVAIKDVNGDGKPDLVAFGNRNIFGGGGLVGVFLGHGDGTFEPVVNYDSGGFGVTAGAIADVNGDGKPDILVLNCSNVSDLCQGLDESLGVLLGNGDGTFRPAVTYASGADSYPTSMVVADVNGDGKPDVLAPGPGTVAVLLGNGDGSFRPPVAYSAGGPWTESVGLADVNQDGYPDLLAVTSCRSACAEIDNIGVLLGNGDGTFQPVVTYSSDSAGVEGIADGIAAGDVDGDGKPDLVVANAWSSTVGVLLGNGDGTFQTAVTYNTQGPVSPGGAGSITVADVNGDGKADLVVGSAGVSVLLGNGDGSFRSPTTYYPGEGGTAVAVGDVNGDGRPDVAVTTRYTVGAVLNNTGAPLTSTSLTASVNPVTVNKTVIYTATVKPSSGGAANGTVVFLEGVGNSTYYSTGEAALVSNQATLSVTYPYLHPHSITAMYSGDLNTAAASLSNTLTESVRGSTFTTLTTSESPSLVGHAVTFSAAVISHYGVIQDGERMTFFDGKTAMASIGLVGGKAVYTTPALIGGHHEIVATYAGSATLAPSTRGVPQIVETYATTTTLKSSANPSVFGQPVTFTAKVTASGPYRLKSRVTFWDGTVGIGSAAVSAGVATLTKPKLAAGTHAITARYPGDSAHGKSVSPVVNQVVQ